jgi:hypothetical protein
LEKFRSTPALTLQGAVAQSSIVGQSETSS